MPEVIYIINFIASIFKSRLDLALKINTHLATVNKWVFIKSIKIHLLKIKYVLFLILHCPKLSYRLLH